jgi:hypothetical protein
VSGLNFWFAHIIDAYLKACATGADWHEAVVAAEEEHGDRPRSVLTTKDLKTKKGIGLSRQHIKRKVDGGTFSAPFKLAEFEKEERPAHAGRSPTSV